MRLSDRIVAVDSIFVENDVKILTAVLHNPEDALCRNHNYMVYCHENTEVWTFLITDIDETDDLIYYWVFCSEHCLHEHVRRMYSGSLFMTTPFSTLYKMQKIPEHIRWVYSGTPLVMSES